jgi:general secretion pathway protein D
VTAKSGDIIVLGGFRKNSNTRSTSRLGPIPFLGDLLGSRSRSATTQELILFLRPTVLVNTPAVDNADQLKRIEKWENPQRDTIKQELDPAFVPPAKTPVEKYLQK